MQLPPPSALTNGAAGLQKGYAMSFIKRCTSLKNVREWQNAYDMGRLIYKYVCNNNSLFLVCVRTSVHVEGSLWHQVWHCLFVCVRKRMCVCLIFLH